MPLGPRISPEVRRLIIGQAILHNVQPRMVLARDVRNLIRNQGKPVPSEQTTAKLVSWARQRIPKEEPWSLAASALRGISPEANEVLFKIWKWCVIVGRTFTVREAKWVARLFGIMRSEKYPVGTYEKVPKMLLMNASRYALEERVFELLGEPFQESTSLDIDLGFPYASLIGMKVRQDAGEMGVLPKMAHPHKKDKYDYERTLGEAWAFGLLLMVMDGPPSLAIERNLGLNVRGEEKLSENGDILYAVWLRKLSEASRWHKLSREKKLKLAESLRGEVVKVSSMKEEKIVDVDLRRYVMEWKPSMQLLRAVGLSKRDKDYRANQKRGGKA
ncbi:hypothetical protein ACFLVS_05505 [Chloroflexota bacterium]